MVIIKYYTEVLCTENYTQMHIFLDVPEATKMKIYFNKGGGTVGDKKHL